MQCRSLLPFRVLALGLALALAACGGSGDDDKNDPIGGEGGTGGVGGSGGDGGTGGMGGTGGAGPEECKQPVIDSLEPPSGIVGTRVVVVGRCFAPSSAKNRVQFNGTNSAAFGVSADGTRLETSVPAGATTGPIIVQSDYGNGFVRTDGPVFTIEDANPKPILNSITPDRITRGATEPVHMTLSGAGFVPASRVMVDGTELESTYTSPTSLQATLPASMLESVKTLRVQVVNDAPGGGDSVQVTFSVVAPINVVSAASISPNAVVVAFDRPVGSGAALNRRAWSVRSGASALSVSKAQRHQDDGRIVVLTTSTQRHNYNYTVTAPSESVSSEGGAIENREAVFRAFGSDPQEIDVVGTSGCGPSALANPFGLTAANNRLYVTESGGQQVQYVNLDGTFGGFLGNDGQAMGVHSGANDEALGCPDTGSTGSTAFGFPRGPISVDGGGDLYVADTGNDRIFRFAASGSLKGTFASGVAWSSPVILGRREGRLWVANGDDKIYSVSATGGVEELFGPGTGPGEFLFGTDEGHMPAMAQDLGRDNQYITDPVNHRVLLVMQGVSPRGWIGKGQVNGFSSTPPEENCLDAVPNTCAGSGDGEFTFPRGIVYDAGGSLWIIDEANGGRLQRFDREGNFKASMDLGFLPGGIAIDPQGYLWIADQDDNVLRKYQI